ncbi:hypothetical protein [Marinifilum fragile]|uniref:hypothetical protein n=1 Tax=Marinifilum fragile TaxID=570161 RepID=UPI002AA65B6B|nr:hypothetical protein [Marinifilum fragile]
MNLHFILLIVAIVIFTLVFYMLWKYGRISRQDVLALTAVIISLAIGLFTFLSRSLPIEIEVYQTSTTLFSLPEENKKNLLSECLYYDLMNNITEQGRNINKQLIQAGIDVQALTKGQFFERTKGASFTYDTSVDVVKKFFGVDPCTIPLVFSISFINKTPNPVVLDELFFVVKNETDRFIYKPMFFVDSKKLFTNDLKKTQDVFSKPFHPFLLTENSDKELHLFCIKWNLKDENDNPYNHQIKSGEYSIELNYHTTSNKKYSKKLPAIKISEQDLLNLYTGTKISIGHESEFYEEILKQ